MTLSLSRHYAALPRLIMTPSLCRHSATLLELIMTLLLLLILIAGGGTTAMSHKIPNNTAAVGCPSSYSCGDSVHIRYPFWTDAGDDSSKLCCGYPVFRLDCRDGNTPLLHLPSGDYVVNHITYDDTTEGGRTLSLSIPAVSNVSCPVVAARNLTLPPGTPPPLSLTVKDTNLTFFINCSFNGVPSRQVACMESVDGQQYSYVFREGDNDMPYDFVASLCEDVVAMPVLIMSVLNSTAPLDVVASGLSMGFELGWRRAVGGQCGSCEDAGGLCGHRREALGGDWRFTCLSRSAIEPAAAASPVLRPHAAGGSSLRLKLVFYAAFLAYFM